MSGCVPCRPVPTQCGEQEDVLSKSHWHLPRRVHSRQAICGSDLHIYGGIIPSMKVGDILGHEIMGKVVEAGPEAKSRQAR